MDRGRGYRVAEAKATCTTHFVIKITGTRKALPIGQSIQLMASQVHFIETLSTCRIKSATDDTRQGN
jgi:hypothetical protein